MSDDLDTGFSPFHSGEQQIQEYLGVRQSTEEFARRVVRDHMPDQHREFYASLPYVLLGWANGRGQLWASILAGEPGFIQCPDSRTIVICARPLPNDPLNRNLSEGLDIGLLGIDLETRRRNRVTGRIIAAGPEEMTIRIKQSFGNCPQYIQSRMWDLTTGQETPVAPRPSIRSKTFNAQTRSIIEAADTFFVATAHTDDPDEWSQGADISHRGGKPGFVKLRDNRTLVFPDFPGNNHFNTIGNISMNDRAGFLFVDFEVGHLIFATGRARIIWDGEELQAFEGAERLIEFSVEEVVCTEESLPLRFKLNDFSELLEMTGDWRQVDEKIATESSRTRYEPYEIALVQPESNDVVSLHLSKMGGVPLDDYQPGQFLPIRLKIPGNDAPVVRTYTISNLPGDTFYRLSVKRDRKDGLVSNFLHDNAKPGYQLEAMSPRGKFLLNETSKRPIALISAGIGITPMISMLNHIVSDPDRLAKADQIHFIHGVENGDAFAFGTHIWDLAAQTPQLKLNICFTRPRETDRVGGNFHSVGRIDLELVKRTLPILEYDFYLCGPPSFMQALFAGLTHEGVEAHRIRAESFGPAMIFRPGSGVSSQQNDKQRVPVRFARSQVDAVWTHRSGTLLELAEAAGMAPAFSCRSGSCGTCATRLNSGSIITIGDPVGPKEPGEILICCSIPQIQETNENCGDQPGLVLDL